MKRFFTSPVVFAGTEKLLGSVPEVAAFHHRAKASCAHRARSWAGFPHPPAGLCRLAAGRIRPQPIQLHLASSEKRALLLFIPLPPPVPGALSALGSLSAGPGQAGGRWELSPPPGSARLGSGGLRGATAPPPGTRRRRPAAPRSCAAAERVPTAGGRGPRRGGPRLVLRTKRHDALCLADFHPRFQAYGIFILVFELWRYI